MNNVLIVAKHEIWATVRRRSFIFMSAIFPVVLVLGVVGLALYQRLSDGTSEPTTTVVGYVDASGLFDGEWTSGQVTYRPYASQEEGVAALLAEEVEHLVLIAPDYLATGQVTSVQEQRQGFGFGRGVPALEEFLVDNLLSERLSDDIRARVDVPALVATVEVDASGNPVKTSFDGGRLVFFLMLAFVVMFGVFMSSGYFQEGLSEEKETRIMEVLLSSVTPRDLMLGKLLGLGVVGLAQTVAWVAFGVGVFVVVRSTEIVQLPAELAAIALPGLDAALLGLAYFVLGYILLGALMSMLGAVTTSHREAQQVVFLFLLPYLIPVWASGGILTDPTGTFARWTSIIPFTSPTAALLRLAMDGMTGAEIAISLGLLAVTTVVAVLVALRIFEAFLLMYGQRPGVVSILRTAVRGA